jgi:nicotinate-nucleotide adenylyltransferase
MRPRMTLLPSSPRTRKTVNIAAFGGTFDPIHSGHLRAATMAVRKFKLAKVLFIPTGNPPHKHHCRLTSFYHRYAMVALACGREPRFVPSLLEAPSLNGAVHYSVDTAKAIKDSLSPRDRLFFIMGADSFQDLPQWREYRTLLELVNIIVVPRPGFDVVQVAKAVLDGLVRRHSDDDSRDTFRLPHTTLSILRGVNSPAASREIREAIRSGKRVTGLVSPLVEQYIVKEGLYRPAAEGQERR